MACSPHGVAHVVQAIEYRDKIVIVPRKAFALATARACNAGVECPNSKCSVSTLQSKYPAHLGDVEKFD
jgi:hypothetical protein